MSQLFQPLTVPTLYLPLEHVAQMVFPGLAADVPAGHGVHVEDPVSLAYVPGSHDVHVAPVYPESG